MSSSLHKLATEIESCIDTETGELDVERWESLQLPFVEKVKNTVKYIENRRALGLSIREKLASQRERLSAIDNNVTSLTNYLMTEMQRVNKQRIDTPDFRVTICKNTQPIVTIISEAFIPSEYITETVVRKIDRRAIGQSWKQTGADINGVSVQQGYHVRIK